MTTIAIMVAFVMFEIMLGFAAARMPVSAIETTCRHILMAFSALRARLIIL
jgi:hypothetical protein